MQLIHTDKAPAAIGPYSQGVVSQGFVFTSGQIALLPETGLMAGDTIEVQTAQCLSNLAQVLQAGGANLSSIVKVVIYLTDMQDFSVVNEIYKAWIAPSVPARSTVAVAALPRGALIEVECIAAIMPGHASDSR